MVSRELIEKVLEAGIRAPSGENSQPWRFKVEGERVWLFNRPEADQSLFNFHQGGSMVSHGALLANMKVAAAYLGCEMEIKLFPDETKEDLIATLDFKETEPEAAAKIASNPESKALYDSVYKRVTNRKHYDGKPLSEHEKKEILANAHESKNPETAVRLVLIEDREKIGRIAAAASTSEMMLVLNKPVHDFFFSHVRWTPEENEIQPNGFYVDTLELNDKQAKGFKMMRKWGVARVLSKLGVATQVGKDNEAAYKTASAMIAVIVKNPLPRSMVIAGKVLEHAWLSATKLGLSVQPSSGGLFLAEGIPHENWHSFSASQRDALLGAKKTIYEALGVDHHKEHVAVVFRVGHSDPPSAQAARFPLKAFLSESAMREETKILPKLATNRRAIIEHILKDLATLKDDPKFENQYAIHELITFFHAIRTYPSYVRWIAKRAPKLDRTRLLELTDLPFPRWDRAMHEKLIEMENRDFPGLVTPLVNRLVALIEEKKTGEPFIGLHLGGGGREVDRQVIKKLVGKKNTGRVVLIGVDKSETANDIAKENFRAVEPFIAIHELDKLTKQSLDELLRKENSRYIIILAKNDIFTLPQDFPKHSFDIIYHTLFKHHLTDTQKEKLDKEVVPLGKKLLEYDGYQTWGPIIPQTLTGWNHPAFLNAEIFSNLRYLTKPQLLNSFKANKHTFHSRVGTYLLELNSD